MAELKFGLMCLIDTHDECKSDTCECPCHEEQTERVVSASMSEELHVCRVEDGYAMFHSGACATPENPTEPPRFVVMIRGDIWEVIGEPVVVRIVAESQTQVDSELSDILDES